ncbi:MAG: twin-arginine translocase TatA/TatE family subunit [Bacteroidales bacterium]|nr:twin-arginine translocase TatA/TatE family subunit [Bacteroidales bacterium]MBN2750405.1 twin-arginine translocase TatA/TatE family subunit [Bacteroidales bacterium]
MHTLAFIGLSELVFIFLAILLLFGSKRIPEVARGLGKGVREFQKATNEIRQEIANATNDSTTSNATPKSAEKENPKPHSDAI